MELRKMKVVRLDKNEFETEDGTIYPHFMDLEELPSLEEFQKIYDQSRELFEKLLNDEK